MSTKENNEITPYNEESKEIVKRIEGPESKKEKVPFNTTNDYYTDTTYENTEYYQEEYTETVYSEEKKSKGIFPILAGLTTIGVIGYFGLNYLQDDSDGKSVNKTVAGVSEVNSTTIQGTRKEELINYYVNESLDIKKKPIPIEESKKEIEKVEEVSISVPKPMDKMEREIEIVKEEMMVQKEKPIVIKKEPIKETPIEYVPIEKEKITVVKDTVMEKYEFKEEPHVVVPQKTRKIKKFHYEKIKPRIITVRDGDTLVSIAERFYNDGMDYRRIINANYRIRSSRTSLHVGQKIVIPRKDGKKRRRFVIVERGDTLASISKDIYGTTDKISTIVNANYRIRTKRSLLRLGQKVYVPRENF